MPAVPHLDQNQLDLIGLGLVAAAAFFAFVFYMGWDGGEVGEALADVFVFLFGGVGYAAPVVLLGAGAVLVLRPLLPSVRPWGAGALCLLAALMLGLAAGSFGLGPENPQREGWLDPDFFRRHGGLVGEGLFFTTKALIQEIGTHILFVFLLVTGVLLLTGASVAGLVSGTREGFLSTTRRVRESTSEFAAVVTGRTRATEPIAVEHEPPDVEPVVHAAYAEMPAPEPDPDPDPRAQAPFETWAPEPGPATAPLTAAARTGRAPAEAAEQPPAPAPEPELTPQGNPRSEITEADDRPYTLPPAKYLKRGKSAKAPDRRGEERTGAQLVEALGHFGVKADVVGTVAGPHVTRYELRLAPGIKMSKVATLRDDLAYALAAADVRIIAPIPGKQAVGVEVPNTVRRIVHLGDVYQEPPASHSALSVWLGKNIDGRAICADLREQPHILVAGTTGSGKSGSVNAMLSSILLRATPNDVRLVLIDPKQVELSHYESIPHLITPVVTSPRMAANVLVNLVKEMEERYALLSEERARKIEQFNAARAARGEREIPLILCVVDELADLMMIAPREVEDAIIRIAQKGRAAGIHLLLATQRPSADIITGMIKANVPSRIAFQVSSQTDSRVILDTGGAETLLGQGDMLFRPTSGRGERIQGAFITEEEIEKITNFWRDQGTPEIREELLEEVEAESLDETEDAGPDSDELLGDAIATVVQLGSASTSMLQRRLRVGYTRAGRLIDMMERRGVISGYEGSKARQVLISEGDLPHVLAALEDGEPVAAAPESGT